MVPVLIVSPAYLAGAIPLGSLIQASLAFTRVGGAFAFCISSYSKIAEWKAMVDRLAGFEDAMIAVDESRAQTKGVIVVEREGEGALSVSGLSIRLPDGSEISGLPTMVTSAWRPGADCRPLGVRKVDAVPGAGGAVAVGIGQGGYSPKTARCW